MCLASLLLKSSRNFAAQVDSAETAEEAVRQLLGADMLFIPQDDNLETLLLLALLLRAENGPLSDDLVLNAFEASLQIEMNREHINTMCARVAEERGQGVDLFIMRKKRYEDFRAKASTEQMLQLFC